MAKLSELVSNVKVKGSSNKDVVSKVKREVSAANRAVKPTVLTKAEQKAIAKRFEENARLSRERELVFQRKRQAEAVEKRKQREAEQKAAMKAQLEK